MQSNSSAQDWVDRDLYPFASHEIALTNGNMHYIDEGEGEPLLLLHGLFGTLSNWGGVVEHFKKNFRVIIPMMPIYTMPITGEMQ